MSSSNITKPSYLDRLLVSERRKKLVRKLYKTGVRQADIGRRFGITRQWVNQIVKDGK